MIMTTTRPKRKKERSEGKRKEKKKLTSPAPPFSKTSTNASSHYTTPPTTTQSIHYPSSSSSSNANAATCPPPSPELPPPIREKCFESCTVSHSSVHSLCDTPKPHRGPTAVCVRIRERCDQTRFYIRVGRLARMSFGRRCKWDEAMREGFYGSWVRLGRGRFLSIVSGGWC